MEKIARLLLTSRKAVGLKKVCPDILPYQGAKAFSLMLGGLLLDIEHRPPDGNPCAALTLEYPQVPTGRTVPLTGTLVNHFISERDHRRVTGNIDLMVIVTELMDFRVLTEITKPIVSAGIKGSQFRRFRRVPLCRFGLARYTNPLRLASASAITVRIISDTSGLLTKRYPPALSTGA